MQLNIEEVPTNEPDGPIPRGPVAAPRGGVQRPDGTKKLAVVLIVIALSLPLAFGLINRAPEKEPPGHGIPSWPEVDVPPWRLYMNVTDRKTISGRELIIRGDILVQKGATLDLNDCNVTMNGTFYVAGSLNLHNSSFRNMPKVHGFDLSTYWVPGSPGIHTDSPTIISNLSGCSRARLNFSAEYHTRSEVSIDVVKDGVRETIEPGILGASNGTQNVSVDLSRFCGGVVRLEFGTDGYIESCHIQGPVIETDRFRTVAEDLIIDWDEPWDELAEFYYPFLINTNGGNVNIEGCKVVRQPSTGILLTAVDSNVRISSSEFREEPAGPGHSSGGTGLLDGERCTVWVRDSAFWGSFHIRTNNSDLRVEDSVFNDQSGSTAWTSNSRVTVTGCRLNSCDSGIFGMIDAPGGRGFVTIQDCVLDCEEQAIGLKSIFGTIERCTIKARYPFVIHPDDRFSRPNCTLASIAAITGNSVSVNPYTYYPEDEIAVWLFSAIPVDGLEALVRNNTWNATVPVARCIFLWLRVDWFPGEEPEASFERNGTRSEYDGALLKTQEATVGEGLEAARERNEIIFYEQPLDMSFSYTWNTRRLIPMDRFFANGTGFSRLRLDERRLDLLVAGSRQVVRTSFDAGVFRHPDEVMRLQNSTSAVALNASDLSLSMLVFCYDSARLALDITFTMETKGMVPDQVELTCELGGRLLESWTNPPWTGPWPALSIDRQNLTSGELVITAIPVAVQDWNLSNNELRMAVNLIDESLVIEGKADLGGLWLLADGADLVIRNCKASIAGAGAVIMGLGNTSLTVEGSTVGLGTGRLSMNVSRGTIRNSDFPTGLPFMNPSTNPAWPSFEMRGGSWDLVNTTLGCRADEFDGYRQVYLSDPLGAVYPWGFPYSGPAIPRVNLNAETSSLNITGSNLLAYIWGEIRAATSITMLNSTLGAGGGWFLMGAERILLSASRFEAQQYMAIGADDLTAEDCDFANILGGVDASGGNLTFTRNRFTATPEIYWAVIGLAVGATNLTLANNTFSGMTVAIVLECAGDPPAVASANSFQNISGVRVARSRSVTVEFLHLALELWVNREISNLTLTDTRQTGWDTSPVWLENTRLNATENRTYNIDFWYVDGNGTEHRITEVRFRVAVFSPSGAVSELDLVIPVKDEERWTVQFG
jgi:hypothetical protein